MNFTFVDHKNSKLIFTRGKKVKIIHGSKEYTVDLDRIACVAVWHPEKTKIRIIDLIDVKTNDVMKLEGCTKAEFCLAKKNRYPELLRLAEACKKNGIVLTGIRPICTKDYIENRTNSVSYMKIVDRKTATYFPLGEAPIPLSVKDTEFLTDTTELSVLVNNRPKNVTASKYGYTMPMRIRVEDKFKRPFAKFVAGLKKCGYTVYEKGKCTNRYLEDEAAPDQFFKLSREGKPIFYLSGEQPLFIDNDDTEFLVRGTTVYAISGSSYKKIIVNGVEANVCVNVKPKYKKHLLGFVSLIKKHGYKVKFR